MNPETLSSLSARIIDCLNAADGYKELTMHEKIAVLKVAASAMQEQANLEATAVMMRNAFNNMNRE